MTRDVGLAEDLAQDALVAALEQWPAEGIPRNPGAWLMAIAKRRGIDHFRHHKLADAQARADWATRWRRTRSAPDFDAALDDDVGDDLLRLIFTACHPVLPTEARVALTLKLLAGFTTQEIARAFLATEPTIQQRIVRAKRTLADKKVPYEVPAGAGARRAARVGARSHLPDLQRRLLRHRRRRLDAAGALRRRAAPRPRARGTGAEWSPRCTAWWR